MDRTAGAGHGFSEAALLQVTDPTTARDFLRWAPKELRLYGSGQYPGCGLTMAVMGDPDPPQDVPYLLKLEPSAYVCTVTGGLLWTWLACYLEKMLDHAELMFVGPFTKELEECVGGFVALTLNTNDEQAFLKALVRLFNVYRADAENVSNSPFAP